MLLEQERRADPARRAMIEACGPAGRPRPQCKLDDEFPELTDALLSVLYPHYLAPVPSMAVAQFVVDPTRSAMPDGFPIARHSYLRTQPIDDLPCRYRTCFPVTLWPVEVAGADPTDAAVSTGLRPAAAARRRSGLTIGVQGHDLVGVVAGPAALPPDR